MKNDLYFLLCNYHDFPQALHDDREGWGGGIYLRDGSKRPHDAYARGFYFMTKKLVVLRGFNVCVCVCVRERKRVCVVFVKGC